ncbi:DHA2 family efflux MFS transporter permease subunit [Solihabitans fulvus]|uniref:DHA2 family efflux MFS transporter permease subunit n=2 Tax=Solihabitans fulvus TaxID=1892852 RepID=A0A5B2WSM5_9PSEU|nr:DHA2 family efflux MFS transporter permease subunit [Solihabitans fulvus]
MQLMIILDGAIVTVALPTIQSSLGFSQSGLAWVVNSYLLAFAGLLLLAGRLGDLIGTRRVFLAGLAVFTAASLLCGVAGNQELLLAGRFAQGVGGALASAVILGMIVRLYPQPGEQARAIGIYSFVSAGGASIGLIGGGVITQALGWHWNFLVNVPIGVLALVVATRLLDRDRGLGLRGGADLAGAVLGTAGLSLGVYTIVRAADLGWTAGQTIGGGAVALILLAAFVLRQATAARPMLPLRIFRARQVTGANIVAVFVYAAGFGFQFLAALYLQRVLGYDAMQTSLAFLPGPIVIGAISLGLSAKLTARLGTRAVLLTGLAAIAAGLLLLSRAPQHGDYVLDVMPALIVMGTGMGMALPALMMLAMSGIDPADTGLASGLVNTTQQAGAAVGLAVLATLATSRTTGLLGHGAEPTLALWEGYHLAFLAAAGFVLVGLVVAFRTLRTAPKTQHQPQPVPAA